MKKRVFISFLGTTIYWAGNYCFDLNHTAEEQNVEYFGQIPLIRRLTEDGNGKLDNISFFVTDQVMGGITPAEAEDYSTLGSMKPRPIPNNYLYLVKRLKELYPDIENTIQPVSMEMNESGMELYPKIVDSILSKFSEKDEVELYIDTTNCMRSVPLSMFTVLNVIEKAFGNVRVKGIYYWRDQSVNTPSGKRIYTIEDLVQTFNDNKLAEELGHFQRTMHITPYITQNASTDTKNIRNLKKILRDLEESMQYVNIMNLVENSRKLVSVTDKIINDPNTGIVLKTYLKPLKQTYSRYMDPDDIYAAIKIANGLYSDAQQIQISVTFMEAIYNRILYLAVKKQLAGSEKIVFASLSKGKVYKLEKYTELSLCLRTEAYENQLNRAYEDLSRNAGLDEKNLFAAIDRNLEELYKKNSKPPVCYRKIQGSNRKISQIINRFMDFRNEINHGDGKTQQDEKEVISSYLEVLKYLYKIFCLNA